MPFWLRDCGIQPRGDFIVRAQPIVYPPPPITIAVPVAPNGAPPLEVIAALEAVGQVKYVEEITQEARDCDKIAAGNAGKIIMPYVRKRHW